MMQAAHGNPGFRPTGDLEASFDMSEIFFSRTDARGKILAGNTVFQRISQYAWDELIGRPHNVIRHPDMPRGLFWLLWDRLRCGLPTGAYVKNRARDGRCYWVYAIITPIETGYLSVRIKPSSALLQTVFAEYSTLLRAETAEALSPAESGRLLLERLQDIGFIDYSAFMTHALVSEFNAREDGLARNSDRPMKSFQALMECAKSLITAATAIAGGYQSHQFVPLNLVVQAGRLGHAGAAIGAISNNFSLISEEIKGGLTLFVEAATRVASAIGEGAFLLGTAQIQKESADLFQAEGKQSGIDHRREMALLSAQQLSYQAEALAKMQAIGQEIEGFYQQTSEMKRLASGFSAIRVMGKVEGGRLSIGVLDDLIADLEAFQQAVVSGLGRIMSINQNLRHNAAKLMDSARADVSDSPSRNVTCRRLRDGIEDRDSESLTGSG